MFFRFISILILAINLHAGSLSKDKHFGVEVNPFYLLLTGSSERYFSGTVSYFDHENNVEIAFPVYYYNEDYNNYKQYTLDMHYRKFINKTMHGFYYSGFARVAKLEGLSGNYRIKQTKLGLGVGIGFRLFSKSGFYWGASLGAGSYITGNNDQFVNNMFVVTDDPRFIFDIELLKFGYSF